MTAALLTEPTTLPAATGRRLVLVDVENAVGSGGATLEEVVASLAAVRRIVGQRDDDVWVHACGRQLLTTAMPVLPRHIALGIGVDGADQRLLEHLVPETVVGRFVSVVLVSGDARAFTEPVTALDRLGVPTDVVSRPEALGGTLRRAARTWAALPSTSFALAA